MSSLVEAISHGVAVDIPVTLPTVPGEVVTIPKKRGGWPKGKSRKKVA